MDLEQLTKTQLILLALLVSFVTSIATGIVTVALVDQAPTDVTRTINRVVEKTVERVVPGETKIVERIKEISNPTQSDLAVGAIDKNRPVLVKLVSESGEMLSRGFFVSASADAVLVAPVGDKYSLVWLGEKSASSTPITVAVTKINATSSVMFVAPVLKSNAKYPFITLKQALVPAIGQQVISVGQDAKLGITVEFSNVVALIDSDSKEGERRFIISGSGASAFIGGPVLDIEGRVLGFQLGEVAESNDSAVLPLSTLDNLFGELIAGIKSEGDQTASANQAVN
jgi:S1-C subfamily serine protease